MTNNAKLSHLTFQRAFHAHLTYRSPCQWRRRQQRGRKEAKVDPASVRRRKSSRSLRLGYTRANRGKSVRETGVRLSRSTISVAIGRAGLQTQNRYTEEIPEGGDEILARLPRENAPTWAGVELASSSVMLRTIDLMRGLPSSRRKTRSSCTTRRVVLVMRSESHRTRKTFQYIR